MPPHPFLANPVFDAPALLQTVMVRGLGGRAIFRDGSDRAAFSVGPATPSGETTCIARKVC